MAAGQSELDLGLDTPPEADGPLPITASWMGHLWDTLSPAYYALGLGAAAEADEVFRSLVLAQIIEPTSKLDSQRVLGEAGIAPPSYATDQYRTDRARRTLRGVDEQVRNAENAVGRKAAVKRNRFIHLSAALAVSRWIEGATG